MQLALFLLVLLTGLLTPYHSTRAEAAQRPNDQRFQHPHRDSRQRAVDHHFR